MCQKNYRLIHHPSPTNVDMKSPKELANAMLIVFVLTSFYYQVKKRLAGEYSIEYANYFNLNLSL